MANCPVSQIDLKFDPVTSVISILAVSASNAASLSGLACDGVASNNYPVYQIDPISGTATGTFPGPSGIITGASTLAYTSVDAHDGNIYRVSDAGYIRKYNNSTNTWNVILGTGSASVCADGTPATSCNASPQTAFVDSNGQVYFAERGRIRTIANGNVVTLYGQLLNFGDGGLATNARLGLAIDIKEKHSDSSYIIFDIINGIFRNFATGGNIQSIAGNGNNQANAGTGSSALTQPLAPGNGVFELDNNDTLYYGMTTRVYTLANTVNAPWQIFSGLGATNYWQADGAAASSINFQQSPNVTAFNGTSFLYGNYIPGSGGSDIDDVISEINVNTGVNNIDIGPAGWSGGALLCAAGTSLSSCSVGAFSFPGYSGAALTHGSYDDILNSWLLMDSDGRTVHEFYRGAATMGAGTYLGQPASGFTFQSFSGSRYLYYCSSANGHMYLRNMDTSMEVALAWPVSSMTCGKSVIYDPTDHTLVFPFTQNGLYGIGKLLNVDPSLNGI